MLTAAQWPRATSHINSKAPDRANLLLLYATSLSQPVLSQPSEPSLTMMPKEKVSTAVVSLLPTWNSSGAR